METGIPSELAVEIRSIYWSWVQMNDGRHMECVAREIEKLAARYHLDLLLCESMAYCHDIFCVLEPKEMLLAVQERYGSLFSMMRNG